MWISACTVSMSHCPPPVLLRWPSLPRTLPQSPPHSSGCSHSQCRNPTRGACSHRRAVAQEAEAKGQHSETTMIGHLQSSTSLTFGISTENSDSRVESHKSNPLHNTLLYIRYKVTYPVQWKMFCGSLVKMELLSPCSTELLMAMASSRVCQQHTHETNREQYSMCHSLQTQRAKTTF